MSWQRYPNANYPQGYDEANMVKADAVPTNVAGTGLTVTEAGAGAGPLAISGADVPTDPRTFTADAAPVDIDEE